MAGKSSHDRKGKDARTHGAKKVHKDMGAHVRNAIRKDAKTKGREHLRAVYPEFARCLDEIEAGFGTVTGTVRKKK